MHHARYMHVLFFNDNVDDDVNDFVIDTWLLSLRNRKLACISLVCTSVDLGSAVFSHPDGKEATVSHSFMKLKLQSSQPTLSYRVGVNVIVNVTRLQEKVGSLLF